MGRKQTPLPLIENVEITGVAAEGKALTRTKIKETDESPIVVFIPFGAPGDKVDIKIDKKKKSFAEGHIERMIEPSPVRVTPRCSHFTICGGCKWQHLPYPEQLKFKQQQVADALTRIAKVDLPQISPILGSSRIWEYRNKMEYTFSNKKWRTWEDVKSGKEFTDSPDALGFHIPGGFDKVYHIDKCYLQEDLGNHIRNFIYEYAEEQGLTFYNIRENKGLLRTLMIRIASTGEIMVCISFGEDNKEGIDQLLNAVSKKFPEITSLLYVINLKLNDTIGDLEVKSFRGPDYIEEEMEGLRFRVNAKSFYQTNSLQAYELYKVTRNYAGLSPERNNDSNRKPLVYDLYTGTGTIANFVARQARNVIGIEYVEAAIEDAKLNASVNGLDNTQFYAGDMKDILTDEFVKRHGHPDVMIIDPPRAG
ncbi:MAG: 23S rRNA (uracil(1939)-C(5))-methyltransferase RlmD, partial [Muribaculaceae bacterium]|nr:23S rRNA (uracil(1939)-C(5))-methyltransferase RlmD [Muribaculaceae bacterium]